MKNLSFVIIFVFVFTLEKDLNAQAKQPEYLKNFAAEYQRNPKEANMQWFKQARFGMFIHYGLYSQLGRGEWTQLHDTIPFKRYVQLKNTFEPSGFNADSIVLLAKKAGMKYITLTTKHHDGFCLFKTKQTKYNSVDAPLSKRDLVGELARACEQGGVGLFFYYSYAADWYHPYFYDAITGWGKGRPPYAKEPMQYKYKKPSDFRKYVNFVHSQLKELLTQYPTIAGIWFDPVMGYYSNPDVFPISETYDLIRKLSPHALISFKQGANGDEDFIAPERGGGARVGGKYPIAAKVYELNKDKYKEVCNTMQPHIPDLHSSGTWGYNKEIDGHHLKTEDVEKLLEDAKANNYNLLLNVGPLPNGAIHPEDIKTLSALKFNK